VRAAPDIAHMLLSCRMSHRVARDKSVLETAETTTLATSSRTRSRSDASVFQRPEVEDMVALAEAALGRTAAPVLAGRQRPEK
jgi:hypothetical protein